MPPTESTRATWPRPASATKTRPNGAAATAIGWPNWLESRISASRCSPTAGNGAACAGVAAAQQTSAAATAPHVAAPARLKTGPPWSETLAHAETPSEPFRVAPRLELQHAQRVRSVLVVGSHRLHDAHNADDSVHERQRQRVAGVILGTQRALAQLAVFQETLLARPRPGFVAAVLAPDDLAGIALAPAHVFVPHAGPFRAHELPDRLEVIVVEILLGAGIAHRVLDGAIGTHVFLHLERDVRRPDRCLDRARDERARVVTAVVLAEPRYERREKRRSRQRHRFLLRLHRLHRRRHFRLQRLQS